MALLSVVMADTSITAEASATSTPVAAPGGVSREARLAAIVHAIDAFGVAVERRELPEHLITMLHRIRDQLEVHNACEQQAGEFAAGTLHAMQAAHQELVREIDIRVDMMRRGVENGLAAHGLLLLWLYHTAYDPPAAD